MRPIEEDLLKLVLSPNPLDDREFVRRLARAILDGLSSDLDDIAEILDVEPSDGYIESKIEGWDIQIVYESRHKDIIKHQADFMEDDRKEIAKKIYPEGFPK